MEVELTDDQQAFVRLGVESGRHLGEADAVREALALWEERERRRIEILAAIDLAEASYARGEGTVISSQAESERLAGEINDIWPCVARESSSVSTADAQVDGLTDTFWLLSRRPRIGRTWAQGLLRRFRT